MKLRSLCIAICMGLWLIHSAYAVNNSVQGGQTDGDGERIIESTDEKQMNQPVQNNKELSIEKKDGEKGTEIDFKTHSDSRPFQMMLLMGNGSNAPRSNGLSYGLHIGYRMNEQVYLGISELSPMKGRTFGDERNPKYNYDDDKVYGQAGLESIESESDWKGLLEMKIQPWRFGLYFSAGILYDGKEKIKAEFVQRPREINGNQYTTGLLANLTYNAKVVPAIGLGYNHVFEQGITLGVGIKAGLARSQAPDVEVQTINAETPVSNEDLDFWKKQIEMNEQRGHYLFYAGIGYAF